MEGKLTGAVLLSSGFSSRMGTFKPLLQFNDKPFFIGILAKLERVCSNVILVTGYNSSLILNELNKHPNLRKTAAIYNPYYESGMFTSLQAGLKELTNMEWIIIHMVDQPDLPEEFYSQFSAQLSGNYDWIQPLYEGHKGHPVAVRATLLPLIIKAPAESTLRTVIPEGVRKRFWDCNFPGVLTDVDTPEDYRILIKNHE